MWRIKEEPFTTDKNTVKTARNTIRKALAENMLTLIVGNGPTRSATLLDPRPGAHGLSDTGWEAAIWRVAQRTGVHQRFLDKNANLNLLALAQAILENVGLEKGKNLLLNEFTAELKRPIKSTLIHKMIAVLSPRAIVTTNYDLQLERVLEEFGQEWVALVRDVGKGQVSNIANERKILVLKMHGTLEPDSTSANKYVYADPSWERSPHTSVIIAESDYDECMHELKRRENEARHTSLLFEALERPILIIGKSVPWQDLSFLYALRATRRARNNAPAYLLAPSLTLEEELNLEIRGITPLIINMPLTVVNEHFYVALVKSLAYLCMHHDSHFEAEIEDFAKEHGLLRTPTFISLGLASHNTTGRLNYAGSTAEDEDDPIYELPRPARRNLRYQADEHAGGAALVACAVFSSLDWEGCYPRSLISVVGRNDIYREEVIHFCKQRDIDIDGIEATASNTWSSTVLVYDVVENGRIKHRGQRIFLDRGYNEKLAFGQRAEEQLRSQLTQSGLRLVYFDKFLALSYPYDTEGKADTGLLMNHKDVLDQLSRMRADVDILYETGATGSPKTKVESTFSNNVNILTAGFPFFFEHVLCPKYRLSLGQWMRAFDQKEFKDTDFFDERNAIRDLLSALKVEPHRKYPQNFQVPRTIVDSGRRWVGRHHSRRWLVVTLHDLGAVTIDLNSSKGVYVPIDATMTGEEIQNTAGAGDAFRGAFCYALLKCQDYGYNQPTMMTETTRFAVTMATRKCERFVLVDALKYLHELSQSYVWPVATRPIHRGQYSP